MPLPLFGAKDVCYIEKKVHYKTNSRIIRQIIRFGLVLELSGW